ncbi:lef-2 [Alphabaculovirus alterspexiguae]|uniref:Lef-2 n=1 Tax=Spodoptera exigua multiple nucleopolyhedrovirus TaxID=10454 RepID=A0A3G2JTS1_9ABAC|nr:lef-2 [Spodoptera exigua multiple nucleopolyhedrovirus]AYN44971.1 lef-2 [Spodoptera exigua multiple nucleopolyhedrovirus]
MELPPPLLLWTPSNIDTIDKSADYSVALEDVPALQITSLTPFADNGLRVKINGTRLFYLIKNFKEQQPSSNKTFKKKSLKNLCFKNVNTKNQVVSFLQNKLRLPDCMQRILKDFEIRPRGNRFRRRFIFNTYIINVLTCTTCNKVCLVNAMSLLYEHEDKCIREFDRLLLNNNPYKPPNCEKLKFDKFCHKKGMCKGKNPICNF